MISVEVTDTFGGEANYSWVRRYELDPVEGQTDLQLVRRVKKVIGWTGARCDKENWQDTLVLRPRGASMVCFINEVNK